MPKIKPFLLGGWLGLSMYICGFRAHDWEFYLVTVPTIIIALWQEANDGK